MGHSMRGIAARFSGSTSRASARSNMGPYLKNMAPRGRVIHCVTVRFLSNTFRQPIFLAGNRGYARPAYAGPLGPSESTRRRQVGDSAAGAQLPASLLCVLWHWSISALTDGTDVLPFVFRLFPAVRLKEAQV